VEKDHRISASGLGDVEAKASGVDVPVVDTRDCRKLAGHWHPASHAPGVRCLAKLDGRRDEADIVLRAARPLH
jgi:hypothetical protein